MDKTGLKSFFQDDDDNNNNDNDVHRSAVRQGFPILSILSWIKRLKKFYYILQHQNLDVITTHMS
jgi:hypothetical protein